LRAEIAVCAADGSGATVWGATTHQSPFPSNSTTEGEIATSETAYVVRVAGDDTAVTNGQRLRLRVYIDDITNSPMVTAFTATLFYDGTSGGASGDSFIILPQTVTEYISVRVPRSPGVDSGNAHL